MDSKNYRRLSNEELIELLFSEEDKLPRAAIDEAISRGSEIVPSLADIVMDRILWIAELPEWWAPVHATYALASIGGREALTPLLSALRWSDAYDNDWVSCDLPSILSSLGEIAYESLISIATDRSAGWSARSTAMDALGSQAIKFSEKEEEIITFLGSILMDETEEHESRRSAAYVMIDFRRMDYKEPLISFAKIEEELAKKEPDYRPAFTQNIVERDLTMPRHNLSDYTHDWLEFYEKEEISKRQRRWNDEDLPSKQENFTHTNLSGKPSFIMNRNGPCPCGSGRPYKRCCWKKLH